MADHYHALNIMADRYESTKKNKIFKVVDQICH